MTVNSFGSNSNKLNQSISRSQNDLARSFERLSSGRRINRVSDDAAGLAIADALASDAVVLRQANRNIADAGSAIEIADSALGQISQISGRLQELATQASNGTLSDAQRSVLNAEYQQLTQEVQRIGATTQFNGQNVLDGSQITVQAGTDSEATSRVATAGVNVTAAVSQVAASAIDSVDGARAAINALQSFSSSVTSQRGDLGATAARLQVASDKNESERLNSVAAESRIRDVDIAEETARKVASQIRLQTGAALGGQQNLNANVVRELLS